MAEEYGSYTPVEDDMDWFKQPTSYPSLTSGVGADNLSSNMGNSNYYNFSSDTFPSYDMGTFPSWGGGSSSPTVGQNVFNNQGGLGSLYPQQTSGNTSFGTNQLSQVLGGYNSPSGSRPTDYYNADNGIVGTAARQQERDNNNVNSDGWWKLPALSRGQAETAKLLTGLAGLFAQRQKANALSRASKQADPYAAYRPAMAQRLEQSYSDPRAYMNSPEAQARMAEAKKAYERTAAKAGRRASPGLALALQAKEAEMMNQYRQGLIGPSGSQFGPATAADLSRGAADANLAAINSPFSALGDIYTSRTKDANMEKFTNALSSQGSNVNWDEFMKAIRKNF